MTAFPAKLDFATAAAQLADQAAHFAWAPFRLAFGATLRRRLGTRIVTNHRTYHPAGSNRPDTAMEMSLIADFEIKQGARQGRPLWYLRVRETEQALLHDVEHPGDTLYTEPAKSTLRLAKDLSVTELNDILAMWEDERASMGEIVARLKSYGEDRVIADGMDKLKSRSEGWDDRTYRAFNRPHRPVRNPLEVRAARL